jgi:membrane protease YdiL (CAAX protease family)
LITLSLVFVQGGFIVITVLYTRYRQNTALPAGELNTNPIHSDITKGPDSEEDEATAFDSGREEETDSFATGGGQSDSTAWDDTPEKRGATQGTTPGARSGSFSGDRRQSGENGMGFHIPVAIPNLRDIGIVIGGYIFAWATALTISIVIQLITRQTSAEQGQNTATETGLQNPEVLFLLLPAMILLVGPGEELLYRGVVQGRLREAIHPYAAIALASAIFGSIHWFALTGGNAFGNLLVLVLLTCVGAVLGISYELSDNIVVPSLIHGFYNATIVLILMALVFAGEQPQESAMLVWLGL